MSRTALFLALALLGVASAQNVRVEPGGLEAVRAERLDVTSRLEISLLELATAVADQPPVGSATDPAEMTSVSTPAGTRIHAGDWTYAATVREIDAESVAGGTFVVELAMDGVVQGAVHLRQSVAEPTAKEGARVVFDIGPLDPFRAMFVLSVRTVLTETVLTSALSATTANYVWRDDANAENPLLSARVGQESRIRAANGEGTAPHNLQVRDGASVIAGPTDDVDEPGESVVLAWTPTRAGAFTYECRYHPSMSGTLEVDP